MNIMAMRWCRLYRGTPAERALEPHIALLGTPYRTQFPYFLWGIRYFPDFLLPEWGIIVEVDDPSHDDEEKKKADAIRTSALEKLGWTVVRCTNDEALYTPDVVRDRIILAREALDYRPGPGLPPIERVTAKKTKHRRGNARGTAGRKRAPVPRTRRKK